MRIVAQISSLQEITQIETTRDFLLASMPINTTVHHLKKPKQEQ